MLKYFYVKIENNFSVTLLVPILNVCLSIYSFPKNFSAIFAYANASSGVESPPAALKPIFFPVILTFWAITFNIVDAASGVAPVPILPVEVLIKSAPPSRASCEARAMRVGEGSSPVSRITFRSRSPHASFMEATSSRTALSSPASNNPRLITISTSSAPSPTAYFTSSTRNERGSCPWGNAPATEATWMSAGRAFRATETKRG